MLNDWRARGDLCSTCGSLACPQEPCSPPSPTYTCSWYSRWSASQEKIYHNSLKDQEQWERNVPPCLVKLGRAYKHDMFAFRDHSMPYFNISFLKRLRDPYGVYLGLRWICHELRYVSSLSNCEVYKLIDHQCNGLIFSGEIVGYSLRSRIYIDTTKDVIETFAHEAIHQVQYHTGQLKRGLNGGRIWKGVFYPKLSYFSPWEEDCRKRTKRLLEKYAKSQIAETETHGAFQERGSEVSA